MTQADLWGSGKAGLAEPGLFEAARFSTCDEWLLHEARSTKHDVSQCVTLLLLLLLLFWLPFHLLSHLGLRPTHVSLTRIDCNQD